MLDEKDKLLLDLLQNEFRPEKRPFLSLAEKCSETEDSVIERLKRLKEEKYVRYIGAFINTSAIGFKSQLIAFHVDDSKIENVAEVINSHPGVSHNYVRNNYYNIWFTLAVPPFQDLDKTLNIIVRKTGIEKYLILPALKVFKLRFVLNLSDEERFDNKQDIAEITYNPDDIKLSDKDKDVLTEIQHTLEVVETPFKQVAEKLGIDEEELFQILGKLEENKIIRRWGTILSQNELGYKFNVMVVWNSIGIDIDKTGELMAQNKNVSHSYYRPTSDDWPFGLYTMIHARSEEDAETAIKQISEKTGITDNQRLPTVRELKKKRLKYFTDDYKIWFDNNNYIEKD